MKKKTGVLSPAHGSVEECAQKYSKKKQDPVQVDNNDVIVTPRPLLV
jgi:hypothetical protein